MLLNKMAQQNAPKCALILEYEIAFKIDQGIQQGKKRLEVNKGKRLSGLFYSESTINNEIIRYSLRSFHQV